MTTVMMVFQVCILVYALAFSLWTQAWNRAADDAYAARRYFASKVEHADTPQERREAFLQCRAYFYVIQARDGERGRVPVSLLPFRWMLWWGDKWRPTHQDFQMAERDVMRWRYDLSPQDCWWSERNGGERARP